MSLVERPFAENLEISLLSDRVGGGISLLALEKLAFLESLLPNFTSQ